MKTNGVPKIRFKGFTDDWEERKLSSGLREYTDRVIVEDDKEYYQISVRNNFGGITLRGSKMGNKIGRKRQAKINLTKYPQTLIFTRQTVEQGGIGWVEKYCDGAIVTENMPTISLDTSVFSKYFLTNLFQTKIFYKNAILDNIEGGSAQIAIHESKFLSSTLLFPNLDEQEKIGSFFKQIDETITLHQRKCEQTKELKKFMLQKMFPKKGEKNPEIRFPGFTDDWEQRKFADFIDVNSGKDYKHLNSGSIPVYGTGGYMLSVDRALSDIDAIGIGRKGTIDKPYLLKAPFWTVDTLFYAVPKQNIDLQFSLSIFKKINWKKFDESTGVPSLSKTVINSVSVSVPSYEEQQKIGEYFSNLDHIITLHQRKCEQLKELKKFMLQNMFPKKG